MMSSDMEKIREAWMKMRKEGKKVKEKKDALWHSGERQCYNRHAVPVRI